MISLILEIMLGLIHVCCFYFIPFEIQMSFFIYILNVYNIILFYFVSLTVKRTRVAVY